MKHVTVVLGFVAIVAMTVFGGVIHGRMSGRWGPGSDVLAAGEKLMEIPAQIGPWKQHGEPHQFDESTMRELEPAGYVERTYVNGDTGERIDLMIIVGAVGRISVHTPEVCVGNQRYDLRETAKGARARRIAGCRRPYYLVGCLPFPDGRWPHAPDVLRLEHRGPLGGRG